MGKQDIASSHWSSKEVRERRIQKILKSMENTPYVLTFRYGDQEYDYMQEIKSTLQSNDPETSWENQSMLLRRIIKLAWARIQETKAQIALSSKEV